MFLRANKVSNQIHKWIVKRIIKTAILEYGWKRNLCLTTWKVFKMCKIWRLWLKNDPMNSKNAEITNHGIMHMFNEVASNKP